MMDTVEGLRERIKTVRALKVNRLQFYEPYPKQMEFHDNGSKFRERGFLAANQCLTAATKINLPDGRHLTIGELYESGQSFPVFSFENGKVTERVASPVFKKPGRSECYRVTMRDGRSFECSSHHRMLTSFGYAPFGSLLRFSPELLVCTDARGSQSVRVAGGRRLTRTRSGYPDDCSSDRSRCGERPPYGPASVLASAPRRGDVLRHNRLGFGSDDPASESIRSRLDRFADLLSSLGGLLLPSAPSAVFSAPIGGTAEQWCLDYNQGASLPHFVSASRSRSSDANDSHPNAILQASLSDLVVVDDNKIVAVEPIGGNEVYDFEVPGPHNYVLAGVVHHNSGKTWSAGFEVAYHATGLYPEWWTGKRFNKPTRGWVSGTSAEGVRDTVQRVLLGGETPDGYGTGTIPKSCLKETKQSRGVTGAVAQIFVRHVSGGTSYIGVRNYEQDLDKWAGESIDWLWFDEEPPRKHYSEGLTRLNARDGLAFMTMTPLKGMTEVVDMFYPHPNTFDRALTMMTLDDVGHYTDNQREQIIASYEEFEREARTKGIPMLGSGRVFDCTEDSLGVDAIQIPDYWPRLGAIDFGYGGHPTGGVAGAWDRDADCIYVTHAYKEAKRTPESMALEFKNWNEGMPWAWPHDGHKMGDRTSGITEAGLYRRAGMRMMREHATFPDGGHGFEAGLTVMLERMRTGRLKVFRHLEPWWREYRTYHRKDGLVVKERDDLMSATRILVMSIHCARVSRGRSSALPRFVDVEYDPFQGVLA